MGKSIILSYHICDEVRYTCCYCWVLGNFLSFIVLMCSYKHLLTNCFWNWSQDIQEKKTDILDLHCVPIDLVEYSANLTLHQFVACYDNFACEVTSQYNPNYFSVWSRNHFECLSIKAKASTKLTLRCTVCTANTMKAPESVYRQIIMNTLLTSMNLRYPWTMF